MYIHFKYANSYFLLIRCSIPSHMQLLAYLHYVAVGSFLLDIADCLAVCGTSLVFVSRAIATSNTWIFQFQEM